MQGKGQCIEGRVKFVGCDSVVSENNFFLSEVHPDVLFSRGEK